MCNAEGEATISLLIQCNASSNAEQIRETVSTSRLHAWVEHNPNFVGSAFMRRYLSLSAKTLSLAAIARNRRVQPR